MLNPAMFVSRTRTTGLYLSHRDPLCISCPAINEHSFQRNIYTSSEPLLLFTGKVIYEFGYFAWKILYSVMCVLKRDRLHSQCMD
jgi:hypothetical protein